MGGKGGKENRQLSGISRLGLSMTAQRRVHGAERKKVWRTAKRLPVFLAKNGDLFSNQGEPQ